MNIVGIIKAVGRDIAKVVEWPFKHAAQLARILHVTTAEIKVIETEAPATKEALVQFIAKVEAMGPDALAAIASKGFDVGADVREAADIKDLFTFVRDTLFTTIKADYDALEAAADGTAPAAPADPTPAETPAPAASAPAPIAQTQPEPNHGLHNVVPA